MVVDKTNDKMVFKVSSEIPEEIVQEALKNVRGRGLQPNSKSFREEFLDEVERLVSE